MHVQGNTEARSRNRSCCGKAVNIRIIVYVWDLGYPVCKAYEPCYIAICDFSGCIIYFHILSLINGMIFGGNIEYKMCFIWSSSFVSNIPDSKMKCARYCHKCGVRVKYSLLFSYCNETWIFSTDFRKILM